tara:strand:- start:9311 stop:9643 length:333 start_codon:yes stop_codon:yes gene_type:complete
MVTGFQLLAKRLEEASIDQLIKLVPYQRKCIQDAITKINELGESYCAFVPKDFALERLSIIVDAQDQLTAASQMDFRTTEKLVSTQVKSFDCLWSLTIANRKESLTGGEA